MSNFLRHFLGKVCTITTVQVNFKFDVRQMTDFFVGTVKDMDDTGILIQHGITKCFTYIFWPHIVSIAEEQVLYENNPEHAKVIEEYRKDKPISAAQSVVLPEPPIEAPKVPPSKFIDADELNRIAENIKTVRR